MEPPEATYILVMSPMGYIDQEPMCEPCALIVYILGPVCKVRL